MTSVTARHVSFSRVVSGPWCIALGATALQPGGRSQVMTSLEHYVTITRAISLTVPLGLPIISVPCIEITKRAPRSVSRAPRARARDADEEEHEDGNDEEERVKRTHRSSPPVHQRYIAAIYRSLLVNETPHDQKESRDSVKLASWISPCTLRCTPPRVLLSRNYTHDSHFRPSSAARTSWVTRFRVSATWNEVSTLSQAASRVRSDLNIATCLRRRSRKV